MPNDITDLTPTIVPKSDQLNAEQLLAGPMTIRVADVRIGSTEEQPVCIHYENEAGRPYKPCKTMRKLLIFAWGKDGRQWIGRAMTLYNEPEIKFGGQAVGGIRISHLSHIDRDINVALTSTRGKKAMHSIKRIAEQIDHKAAIAAAKDSDALKNAFRAAWQSTADNAIRSEYQAAYDKRKKDFEQSKGE